MVSAFPEVEGRTSCTTPAAVAGAAGGVPGRGRTASCAAAQRDRGFRATFLIRPAYNPIGPLDLAGCYDERSDRHVAPGELVDRGYEDAYRQFIDPVVGAGGERLEEVAAPAGRGAAGD